MPDRGQEVVAIIAGVGSPRQATNRQLAGPTVLPNHLRTVRFAPGTCIHHLQGSRTIFKAHGTMKLLHVDLMMHSRSQATNRR